MKDHRKEVKKDPPKNYKMTTNSWKMTKKTHMMTRNRHKMTTESKTRETLNPKSEL